jgi:hypothetical protein
MTTILNYAVISVKAVGQILLIALFGIVLERIHVLQKAQSQIFTKVNCNPIGRAE